MPGRKCVDTYLPPQLAKELENISDATGISESEILRESFSWYLLIRQSLKRIKLPNTG